MSSEVNVTASIWDTTRSAQDESMRHLSTLNQTLISFLYVFGVGANICSLILLKRGKTPRNRKQTLMVRCLIWNDLLALVGSFFLMYVQLYLLLEDKIIPRWFCILRVLLRTFGLSSGSVATVMAVERWLALTRPFFYQQHITHKTIKIAIGSLLTVSLIMVCLPFMGFGLYYDINAPTRRYMCVRYRFATKTVDVAYAYFMFTFGMILCVVIVLCNLTVVTVLSKVGKTSRGRMGRTTICKISRELLFNHATQEEISFARLMVVLCVFFLICWVPLMMTIVIAQWDPHRKHRIFYRIADICMALNFILDPVIYVLSRRPHRQDLRSLFKPFCLYCFPQVQWLNTNDSKISQKNSGYLWNFGMSAVNLRTSQDALPERSSLKQNIGEEQLQLEFHSRGNKCQCPRENNSELGVSLDRDPAENELMNPALRYQRTFIEPIMVQIKIQSGHNPCFRFGEFDKKKWSKLTRGQRPCCRVNCSRDFVSDDCGYMRITPICEGTSTKSSLTSHSLPESRCLGNAFNNYSPDVLSKGDSSFTHHS
ncbi:prostaglandin E2 receptor EP2 subtype-like [Limulus polyphemus]|uniref:Prostaglandin E2 receptor EP2 subtype-like n=1 Tax=Limulus polyphemus TaxID=6850 RepID=A0ABM1T0K4_LIMPO|nr:prostaglandin E2 receptor EP2 subtype-like [Limulus polyphemus]